MSQSLPDPGSGTAIRAAAAPGSDPSRAPLRWLVAALEPEGAGAWVLVAARALSSRGHEVRVFGDRRTLHRAGEAGLRAERMPAARELDPRPWIGLRRVLGTWRPEAILCGDDRVQRRIARASSGLDLPPCFVVYDPNGGGASGNDVPDRATLLIPGSRGPGLGGVPVAPGVPTIPVPPDRTLLRRELRLPRRDTLVVQVDPLVPGAGQETTLRALAVLRGLATPGSRMPTMLFVGTGPEESNLHVLSHDLDVQKHVQWLGFRRDAVRYVHAADLLVAPIETVAARDTVLAALAAGVPVIAADVPGLAAWIDHEATGLLVPPADAAALGAALAAILRDPGRAAAMGQAGRTQVESGASETRLAIELECLAYAQALGRRPPRSTRPALFVDRDGTLVRNVPYNADPGAVVLEPDAAWVLRCFRAAGYAIVVASNQSAVARGWCSEADVRAVNERMRALLRAEGTDVDAVYWCPHHPEYGPACDCRKPEPGMMLRAARELGLDLADAITIGDEPRDLEAGRRAGTAIAAYTGSWLALAHGILGERWAAGSGRPTAGTRSPGG